MWILSKYKTQGEKDLPDEEMLVRYRRSRDPSLIGSLFTRYTHLVYGVCLKYLKDEEDARDAVMDIFEDLMHRLLTHEVETFRQWLYTVSKNHCLMILRKEASVNKVKQQWLAVFSREIMDSVDVVHLDRDETEMRLGQMIKALRKLNDEQRTCLELLYMHEKSYQEVAEMTGFSLNQVKSYIQNGKRNMKIMLHKEK